MSAPKWNRKLHRWGAVAVALPVLVILVTGLLLQVKKHWSWVQPLTVSGSTSDLQIPWERVLEIVASVPESEVTSWGDIDRLDVRPGKGMLKVRCKNRWEVQLDTASGEVLSSTLRRSDVIESLHDGSWFHPFAKLGVFLPSALVLTALWVTGMYLWLLPYLVRRRRRLAHVRQPRAKSPRRARIAAAAAVSACFLVGWQFLAPAPASIDLQSYETFRPVMHGGGLSSWEELGPHNIGGRVRTILPFTANDILLGSVVGGIWKTTDGGATWTSVNDFLPSLAVTSLVRDPIEGKIYAGTGEGNLVKNARLDGTPGAGIYVSEGFNSPFEPIPSTTSWANDPDDRFVNRVAARGGIVLAATNGGIYRSVAGGAFTSVVDTTWVSDVKWTSSSTAVAGLMTYYQDVNTRNLELEKPIVCALYSSDHGFTWTPSQFVGAPLDSLAEDYTGGDSIKVYRPEDYRPYDIVRVGDAPGVQIQVCESDSLTGIVTFWGTLPTWLPMHATPVQLVPSRRTELAVHRDDPSIVYALVGTSGGTIWKSTDAGATFQFVSNPFVATSRHGEPLEGHGVRVFYVMTLWVSPDDPDLLVIGGTELYRSENGGHFWHRMSTRGWNLRCRTPDPKCGPHPDHHTVVAAADYNDALGNRTVYSGNDGGIYRAPDVKAANVNDGWENINWDLGITQFYGGAAVSTPVGDWYMGGGQDNGRPHMHAPAGQQADPNAWTRPYDDNIVLNGLDGGADDKYGVAIDPSENPSSPTLYTSGINLRIYRSTSLGDSFQTKWPAALDDSNSRLFSPFILDPNMTPNIVYGGGESIYRSTNKGDNWTVIWTSNSTGSFASALDLVREYPDVLWVGFDDGTVARTDSARSGDPSFSELDNGQLPSGWITDIAASPTDRNELWVTFDHNELLPGTPTIWYTDTGGDCWEPRMGLPPYEMPPLRILSVRVHPSDPNRVYLGTDRGVISSEDRGMSWNRNPLFASNDGPANVEVWELSWQDDYLVATTNGRGLFRSLPAQRADLFASATGQTKTGDDANSQGAAWGDYDNDGDPDLFVSNHSGNSNRLYRNDGIATGFAEQAGPLGVAGPTAAISTGAGWGDFDNDGDLDLYVVNAGAANVLYRNDGPVGFADLSPTSATADSGNARGMSWIDYDNDGWLDLYVVNVGQNVLYRNQGDGTFTDESSDPIDDSGSGQTAAWGDYDDDGDLDVYVTNSSLQSNKLLRNDGSGSFTDVTVVAGVGGEESSNGAAWADMNGDGTLDLYVVNEGTNKLYVNPGIFPFLDISTTSATADSANGRGVAWFDFDRDADLDLYVTNFDGPNKLYRNESASIFVDDTELSGVDDASASRSASVADYDGDGWLDVYVTNAQPNAMFRNAGRGPDDYHWLRVKLVGTQSNRSGVGAKLTLYDGCRAQRRDMVGDAGFYSQSEPIVDFGLGSSDEADSLVIRWPSGTIQRVEKVAADRTIVIVEPCAGDCLPTDAPPTPTHPTRFRLYANAPNPFNPTTLIRFDLPSKSRVELHIYDLAGRRVRTLVDAQDYRPGAHQVLWHGRDDAGTPAASGVYFARMRAQGFSAVQKIVLLK